MGASGFLAVKVLRLRTYVKQSNKLIVFMWLLKIANLYIM